MLKRIEYKLYSRMQTRWSRLPYFIQHTKLIYCVVLHQLVLYINLLIRHIDSKMNKREINNNSGARTVQQRYNIGYTVET